MAPDLDVRIKLLVRTGEFLHVNPHKIICFRSIGAKTRARARIWSFPRIWQIALKLPPHYVIEVIAERFDNLKNDDQDRVLIHELMHIPKNFSGALLPHRGRGRAISAREVEKIFRKVKDNTNN